VAAAYTAVAVVAIGLLHGSSAAAGLLQLGCADTKQNISCLGAIVIPTKLLSCPARRFVCNIAFSLLL
jgi:hypothetical protein